MTQKDQILKHLQNGHKLNNLIATKEYGCVGSSLAFAIHSLRKEGHQIETERKRTARNKGYAEYSMPRPTEQVE